MFDLCGLATVVVLTFFGTCWALFVIAAGGTDEHGFEAVEYDCDGEPA